MRTKQKLLLLVLTLLLNDVIAQSSLRELILSCNIQPNAVNKKLSVDKTETKNEPDENGVSRPCYYETWSEVATFDEIISLNPNNNTIWPGAAVQGRSLKNGSLELIPLNRTSGRITLSGINFDDNLANYADIKTPSESSVKTAINKLLSRKVKSTEANFSYSSIQTYSYENSLQSLGLSASWAWGDLSSLLSTNDYKSKNNFVIKLTQKYYSVSFEDPESPEDIFTRRTKIKNANLYMGAQNPPALITNVNYGRIIILSFSTSESVENFKAALNSSFNGWIEKGQIDFKTETNKILANSEIKIFAIGGSSEKVAKVITGSEGKNKMDVLREYIESGAEFSLSSLGVPIGYKAIYLANNQVAAINSSMEFKKVRCDFAPYRKPLKVTLTDFVIYDVTDDDEDMEFAYEILFLGQTDQVIDKFGNRRGDTYVEEPGKVGGEREGKNRFFSNESRIVNAPVFKVKCVVWAKSNDGDCDRAWGERGATVERIYTLPEFTNTPEFHPWGSIKVKLRIE